MKFILYDLIGYYMSYRSQKHLGSRYATIN